MKNRNFNTRNADRRKNPSGVAWENRKCLPIQTAAGSYLPLCINQEQLLLSRDVRGGRQRIPPTIIPVYQRINGLLDAGLLRKALYAVTQRHTALRSSFHYDPALSTDEINHNLLEYSRTGIVKPGVYVQQVAGEVPIDLATHAVTRSALRDMVSQELVRDFDRHTPPRLRASLFELADDEHLLLIVLDHLVSDGWSVRLLERELHSLYLSFARSTPSALKEPGMPYPDFAKWQNESFQTPTFNRAVRYWQGQWERFGDTRIGVQDFPFALATPPRPSSDCASWQVTLDPACSGEARRVAAQQRITLFMLFLAVWALVLRRYTGKDRFPIWAHFNNRVRPETHRLFGYLINTHIIGLDLGQDTTGLELLEQVRRAVLEAAAHQELPLPQCWRAMGAAPRFNEAFVMLDLRQGNAPLEPADESSPIQMTRGSFPDIVLPRLSKLGVYVTDHQRVIDVSVVYCKDAFHADSIRLMLEHVKHVLSALVANPAARISELSAYRTS